MEDASRTERPAGPPGPDAELPPRRGMVLFTVLLFFKLLFARACLLQVIEFGRTFVLEMGFVFVLLLVVEIVFWRWRTLTFVVLDFVLTAALLAVLVFYNYSSRVVTFESIALLGQVPEVGGSVASLFKWGYFLFLVDIVVLAVVLVLRRNPFVAPRAEWSKIGWAALFAVGLIVNSLWGTKLDTTDSLAIVQAKGLFGFQVEHALGRATSDFGTVVAEVDLEDPASVQARIQQLKGIEEVPDDEREFFGAAEGRHVFCIQVETMQSFVVGLEVEGQRVTPELDELREEAFYWPGVIQQISAGNTSDDEFMLNTSIYPLESEAVSIKYGDRSFPSLPRRLGELGYSTMTLHPNEVTFWNRIELYPALGFERYYDEPYFEGGETIGLGPSDGVLFERALEAISDELAAGGGPIYANLITLSTHHPYELPEQYVELDMPEGADGTLPGNYVQAMHYIDARIGEFVDGLRELGIYEESIVLVRGDHFGLPLETMTADELDAMRVVLGHDYHVIERFAVPLIIVAPGIGDGSTSQGTAGQLDAMPTIANLLGVSLAEQVHFGQDLLNSGGNLLGIRYYRPTGTVVNDRVMYVPAGASTAAATYDLRTGADTGEAASLAGDSERAVELMQLSDAYVDSLPVRDGD